MSHSLDIVSDDHPWTPMSREQFRQLRRHDRLRDRQAREWGVTAAVGFNKSDRGWPSSV
jgi:hypothetical protein